MAFVRLDRYELFTVVALALVIVTAVVVRFAQSQRRTALYDGVPIAGDFEKQRNYEAASEQFGSQGFKVVHDGLKEHSGIFQVITGTGPRIIVPPKYIDEIKSHKRLSFSNEIAKQLLAHYPGFEVFRSVMASEIFQDTIKKKITQSLNLITEKLSEETEYAVQNLVGDSKEWHDVNLGQLSLGMIAALSTRVFLGEDYSRNPEWLKTSLGYTEAAMQAAQALYRWPDLLRPFAARFLPVTKEVRKKLKEARALLQPEISKRRQARAAAIRKGLEVPPGKDALDWMDEVANGRPFDVVLGQLLLTVVAVLTTSGLFTELLLNAATYPEYLPTLRQEIMDVIQESGWKRTALHKLRQMDSWIKESQRVTPSSIVTMRRRVEDDIKLSDGTALPKGASIMVPTIGNMRNGQVYSNPNEFDPWRFFRMWQNKESEARAQLTTPTADHMGFGLGQHACPGRFMAATELKVAMCHLLLKYEWRFAPGQERPKNLEWETELFMNPMATMQMRRRNEEMVL